MRHYRRIVVDDKGAARRGPVDWLAVTIFVGIVVSVGVMLVGIIGFVRFSIEMFTAWLAR